MEPVTSPTDPLDPPWRVDPSGVADTPTLAERHRRLDARGLRSTGSPAHEAYIDDLEQRLAALGLSVVSEEVPVRRWTARHWSLDVVGGDTIHVGSYIPYSGRTDQAGVCGPLSREPGPGVIGLVDVETLPLRERDFAALDWDAPDLPEVPADRDLDAPYTRVWLSQDGMRRQLTAFKKANAAGVVFVVDGLSVEVDGSYLLYDGVLRDLPALVVDRERGALLSRYCDDRAEVRLTLEADVDDVSSRNLYAVVEGAGPELVIVQSHTDGTNALEDNGPEAIVAMAEHLADRPRHELPRGMLLLLSTGHFTTHTSWGTAEFMRRHRHDLVARTAAALSVEHLGSLAWTPHDDGYDVTGGYELGCFFASPHRAVVDVVRRALDRAEVTDSLVLRPFAADETGEAPDGLMWPGDGAVLWAIGQLPSANFITGSGYLLTTMDTTDLIDIDAMRRQAVAFLEAALELAHLPRPVLAARIDR